MAITFAISEHDAEPLSLKWKAHSKNQHQILARLSTSHKPAKLLKSSVDGSKDIIAQKNGLVLGALLAYNQHHNLVIRPDDVWIAIICQLNFYINAHAEELRDKFVPHSGKKELVVISEATEVGEMDFGDLAVQLNGQLQQNVKDRSLIPWMLPNFSTTTANDTVICSVLVMATLKEYFSYTMRTRCGIPSVTLEGTQADWQLILDRVDKIPEFGAEPAEWAGMLRVILIRFVRAFDAGGPEADKGFWERIIHEQLSSGTSFLSGWMTAFCAWNAKGVYFDSKKDQGIPGRGFGKAPDWVHGLTFDRAWFPRVHSPPVGYAEVDVRVIDTARDEAFDCAMLAGHVGISISGNEKLDTIHIAPQWFMYVKEEGTA